MICLNGHYYLCEKSNLFPLFFANISPLSLSKVDAVHWLAHLTSQYCKDQGSIPELKGKKWLALKPLIVQ